METIAPLLYCPTTGCLAFPFGSAEELEYHLETEACVLTLKSSGRREVAMVAARPERTGSTGPARQAAPAELSDVCSWTKVGDAWGVRGPARVVVPGATVTVENRKGEAKSVTVGTVESTKRKPWDAEAVAIGTVATPERAARPARQAAPQAPAEEAPLGLHELDGQVFKVVTSAAGRRYAKRLQGKRWMYDAGAVRKLSAATVLSKEDAVAYGKATGICRCCGAHLEDPKSVAAGIGPWCAKNAF
jgi:hypothetical protein